jgi:hypothetical protein
MPPRAVLSIDPGLRKPAAAVWIDGRLRAASRVSVPSKVHQITDIGERSAVVAELLVAWAREHALPSTFVDVVVYEFPQVYTRAKSKGDPNDLLPLVAVGQHVAARVAPARIVTFKPADWAKQTAKAESGDPLLSQRGRLVTACLLSAELAALVPSHDSVDAVGLGLHYLDRFWRRGGRRIAGPPTDA